MNLLDKIKKWMAHHKVASVILVVLVLVVGAASILDMSSPQYLKSPISQESAGHDMATGAPGGFAGEAVVGDSQLPPDRLDGDGGEEVEVKEASLEVDSEDAKADAELVRNVTERINGHIERSHKSETNRFLTINMTARVSVANFEEFIEELRRNLEVEDYNINNFRLPVQREIDELDILRRSLDEYNSIREEIMAMPVGEEKINLLMDVTNKELELKQREKSFKRSLSGKQERSEMSTVRVTLKQRLEPELWPEEVANRFRDGLKRALDNVVDSLIATVAGGISFVFQVLNWFVYALIIIVPVALLYKIGKKLYRRFGPRDEG